MEATTDTTEIKFYTSWGEQAAGEIVARCVDMGFAARAGKDSVRGGNHWVVTCHVPPPVVLDRASQFAVDYQPYGKNVIRDCELVEIWAAENTFGYSGGNLQKPRKKLIVRGAVADGVPYHGEIRRDEWDKRHAVRVAG